MTYEDNGIYSCMISQNDFPQNQQNTFNICDGSGNVLYGAGNMTDIKHIQRLNIAAEAAKGSELRAYILYDGEGFDSETGEGRGLFVGVIGEEIVRLPSPPCEVQHLRVREENGNILLMSRGIKTACFYIIRPIH